LVVPEKRYGSIAGDWTPSSAGAPAAMAPSSKARWAPTTVLNVDKTACSEAADGR
jgi:hypothetical protein